MPRALLVRKHGDLFGAPGRCGPGGGRVQGELSDNRIAGFRERAQNRQQRVLDEKRVEVGGGHGGGGGR